MQGNFIMQLLHSLCSRLYQGRKAAFICESLTANPDLSVGASQIWNIAQLSVKESREVVALLKGLRGGLDAMLRRKFLSPEEPFAGDDQVELARTILKTDGMGWAL